MHTFFASLGCVWFLRYAKRRIIQGEGSKLNRVALVVAVNFFFLGEAYIMGVVIQNFLVPPPLPSLTLLAVQYGVTFTYFVSVSFFTRTEMKRLIRDKVRAKRSRCIQSGQGESLVTCIPPRAQVKSHTTASLFSLSDAVVVAPNCLNHFSGECYLVGVTVAKNVCARETVKITRS